MRYADYYNCDICNGNSVGMSLFVSGCPIHCPGCFNADIWDFNSGNEWTPEIKEKFLKLVGRDYIKRVSILGGEPLCNENIKDVMALICEIKDRYPDKQIWVYTGQTIDKIYEPMGMIDVLVDGPFIEGLKDVSIAFRGSINQRIIDVKRSIESGQIILWKDGDY